VSDVETVREILEAHLLTDEIQMLMRDIWTGVVIINLKLKPFKKKILQRK